VTEAIRDHPQQAFPPRKTRPELYLPAALDLPTSWDAAPGRASGLHSPGSRGSAQRGWSHWAGALKLEDQVRTELGSEWTWCVQRDAHGGGRSRQRADPAGTTPSRADTSCPSALGRAARAAPFGTSIAAVTPSAATSGETLRTRGCMPSPLWSASLEAPNEQGARWAVLSRGLDMPGRSVWLVCTMRRPDTAVNGTFRERARRSTSAAATNGAFVAGTPAARPADNAPSA
jgi:hypothetical protein